MYNVRIVYLPLIDTSYFVLYSTMLCYYAMLYCCTAIAVEVVIPF